MTTPIARSVTELDQGVATRQAIGAAYRRPKNPEERVERLKSGIVYLRPHGDWDGDYTDWHANPFNDSNWQFQFHSLHWAAPLRWAALDGDEEARAEWLRITRSWFEANVPFRAGLPPFAWVDMADGNRAIQLSQGVPLLAPEDDWYVELLQYHRDWLMDPSHIKTKNHALHQHAGLLVVGATLRDRTAMDTAVSRMEEQFPTAFDAQGCNDEGSVGYQQHNLSWWGTIWRRAELEGYSIANVAERLRAGAHALAHLAMPDGQLPQIGDSSRGRISSALHPYTEFAATRGAKGAQPEGNVLVLDGGYVISRSGWGEDRPLQQESHMVLRHGLDVRAHSHQDRGSLHIYAAGTRWLTDSGFHSYQRGDPTRRYLDSREAHNVAFLPDRPHHPSAPVDLVSRAVTDTVHDFTVADRGYEHAELSRRVVFLAGPNCWIVIDSSNSVEPSSLRQHWHLEPGTFSSFRDHGFRLRRGKQTMTMTWLGKMPHIRRHVATEGHTRGWISTGWKTLTPSQLLTATTPALAAGRMVTVIAVTSPEPFGVVDSLVRLNGEVEAMVVRGGTLWNIRIFADRATAECV